MEGERGMVTTHSRSLISRVFAKISTSLVVGLATFGLTQTIDSSATSQVLISIVTAVFVAGIAFLVQFLIDVEARIDQVESASTASSARTLDLLEHHFETSQISTRSQFEKINAATQLFGAVEASALRIDETTQLVRDAATVMQNSRPTVARFAHAEIARLGGVLRALGNESDVSQEGEHRDWLLGLVGTATATIDSISLAGLEGDRQINVDNGFWHTDVGQRYIVTQSDAIRRHVVVRRVFIIDDPEVATDWGFLAIIRQNLAVGVQIRLVVLGDVPGFRRSSIFELTIIDGEITYQSLPGSRAAGHRSIIASTALITSPERVRAHNQTFGELWHAGRAADLSDRAEWGRREGGHDGGSEIEPVISMAGFLDTTDRTKAMRVFRAMDELASAIGYGEPVDDEFRRGSFWRRARAWLQSAVTSEQVQSSLAEVERSFKAQLEKNQAAVNAAESAAVAALLAALDDVPLACLSVGSIFLVKSLDSSGVAVVQVRMLSTDEMRVLQDFPEIQKIPQQAMDKLALAVSHLTLRSIEGPIVSDTAD